MDTQKQLSKDQVRVILQNAPANLDKSKIVKSLVDQGYQLEGFGQVQQPVSSNPIKIGIENIKEAIKNPLEVIPQRIKDVTPGAIVTQNPDGTLVGHRQEAEKAINTAMSFTPGGLEKSASGIINPIKTGIEDISKSLESTAQESKTVAKDFIEKLITPKLSQGATESAIKTGRVVEGSGLLGSRNFTEALPNFDKIKSAVETVPGLSNKNTLLENSNLIHDEISKVAESLKAQLKDKGFFSPSEFSGYLGRVKAELADNPILVGDSEKVAGKIVNKFKSLVKENGYTPEGLLNARKQLDGWMSSQKGGAIFDPSKESAVSVALRAIRQGGNKFLAEKVPDVAVQDLLSHQSALYQAIENIAPKAAKEGINKLQRFAKANPNAIKALKFGATAVGGGAIVGALSQ